MMRQRVAVLTGVGLGIGLIYFLDPTGGRRRRALVRDTLARSATVGTNEWSATAHDLMYRASRVAAGLGGAFRRPVDDDLLIDRLREQISGAVSHPHLIEVEASDHHVILRGSVLEREVDQLLDAVERTSGVREIINALDVHRTFAHVTALEDRPTRGAPRLDMFEEQWGAAARLVLYVAGGMLAGYGASRRDLPGAMLAAAGGGLFARAASNVDPRGVTRAGMRGQDISPPRFDAANDSHRAHPSAHWVIQGVERRNAIT